MSVDSSIPTLRISSRFASSSPAAAATNRVIRLRDGRIIGDDAVRRPTSTHAAAAPARPAGPATSAGPAAPTGTGTTASTAATRREAR